MRRSTYLYLSVLVGCADSIALDDYSPAIWQATCDWYVRCGALLVEDCVRHLYAPGENSAAAAHAGLASYDGEAAAACVALYAELPCNVTEPYPDFSICNEVYRGHGELGESCLSDLECASGVCWYPNGYCENACCDGDGGICDRERPREEAAQLGEECDLLYGAWCARGLYCDTDNTNQPGLCVPLPNRGESCEGSCAELGDNCDSITHLCEDASVGGEPCVLNSDCTDYYWCGPDGRCVAEAGLQLEGSDCMLGGYDIHSRCRSGWCDEGSCAPTPVCY